MLNFNNISLLLIIIITLLLIHINYKKKHIHIQDNEPFVDAGSGFDQSINNILVKVNNEINESREINNLLRGINEKNNQDKKFIITREDGEITDIKYKDSTNPEDNDLNNNQEIITINPTTDLKKLRNLNDEIKNTNVNVKPILQNIDSKIKQLRINKINNDPIFNVEESVIDEPKNIRQIKNNLTGKSLNVEKVKPNDENDNQYYIYLNSVNNNNVIEYRCLSYNDNNPDNPYETKKCDKNDNKQKFELDKMTLSKKCYNYPNPDMNKPNGKKLEECVGASVIKLENKKEFVEKINKKISDDNKFFHLTENNIFTVPKQFSFISPINKDNECLTIDQEGISFQDCINNPTQQWNYSNENISC